MSSTGFDRRTGKVLRGWAHVEQSIEVILTTKLALVQREFGDETLLAIVGPRLMRREFGSELLSLLDRPMLEPVILQMYASIANALQRWEPRFELTGCRVTEANEKGQISVLVAGYYLPNGHRGIRDRQPQNFRETLVDLGLAA